IPEYKYNTTRRLLNSQPLAGMATSVYTGNKHLCFTVFHRTAYPFFRLFCAAVGFLQKPQSIIP
ncbi:hypothetical protein, partial [Escherichia coli]|uniref:hypothetical protein n=1 Tax=Escherichia coli TaxID=562 RepID=UPI001B8B4D78